MTYVTISTSQIQPSKAVKTELLKKIKDNLDDHETRLALQESGGSIIEVLNCDFYNVSSAATMTGLFYHKALFPFTVTKVEVQIFEKGSISTGSIEIDVKKNTTPDDTGMTSILSVKPIIDFSSASDYDADSGTLNATYQDILEDEFLRVDVTALPTSPLGKFRIVIYGAL